MTARRFMMPASRKAWTFVGLGAISTSETISFPSTAQARDLAVVAYAHASGARTLPSGYTWVFSGSTIPRMCFKVCAGGETSVARPNDNSGSGAVMLFRPEGGAPFMDSSAFDDPPTSRVVAALSPGLVIGSTAVGGVSTFSVTAPGGYSTQINLTTGPALHAGYLITAEASSGTYLISASSGAPRQVLASFGIS